MRQFCMHVSLRFCVRILFTDFALWNAMKNKPFCRLSFYHLQAGCGRAHMLVLVTHSTSLWDLASRVCHGTEQNVLRVSKKRGVEQTVPHRAIRAVWVFIACGILCMAGLVWGEFAALCHSSVCMCGRILMCCTDVHRMWARSCFFVLLEVWDTVTCAAWVAGR